MSENPNPALDLAQLKQTLANVKAGTVTMSADELFVLYEQLVGMLDKPRTPRSTMTPEEKREHRRERREARKRGEYVRVGKPWTEEQRAKQQAAWTPERREAQRAKAVGRTPSPETVERIRASAAARKERQAAMEARLAELEAIVAGQAPVAVEGGEETPQGRRRGGHKNS